MSNRDTLKVDFGDGKRPEGSHFADLIDSFLHLDDDGLQVEDPEGTLVLDRGLGLGDSTRTVAGTLRFHGGSVQFHDGTEWVDLAGGGGGGGGAFQPVGDGGDVAFGGGNVGIGTEASPTYRLEVELGENDGEADRARFGNAVCSNGPGSLRNDALFYHRNQAAGSAYALRQRNNGEVRLNAPGNQRIRIEQNGNQTRLAISDSGAVIVNGSSNLSGAGAAVLQVQGEAFKNQPGGEWQTPSDARLKEDVRDLEAGLEQLVKVRPVRFRYNGKAGTPAGREGVGILGQEMEKVFPEMVQRVPARIEDDPDAEDLLLYDGSALTFVLVNAVKELADKVKELEAAFAETGERS